MEVGGWRLEVGGSRLEVGGWRLEEVDRFDGEVDPFLVEADTRHLTVFSLLFSGFSIIHNAPFFWAKFNRINPITPPRFRTFVSYIFSVTLARFYTQL